MSREVISTTLDKGLYLLIQKIAKKGGVNANDLIEAGMKYIVGQTTDKCGEIKESKIDLDSLDVLSKIRFDCSNLSELISTEDDVIDKDKYNISVRKACEDLRMMKTDIYKLIEERGESFAIKKVPPGGRGKEQWYIRDEIYQNMMRGIDTVNINMDAIYRICKSNYEMLQELKRNHNK